MALYVPIGSLPSYVQSIIHYFPVSHTTVLLREVFMSRSIETVFYGDEILAENYMLQYGVIYEINSSLVSSTTSILLIFGTIIVIGTIALLIFIKKNK